MLAAFFHKKGFALFFACAITITVLGGAFCATFFFSETSLGTNALIDDSPKEDGDGERFPEFGYFPIFSLNVHDWGNIDESIAATERVLDIHEQYGIPVDIYFTDPLFRLYVEKAPDLIERIKTSPIATAAYHIRPPTPYYSGFDFLDLSAMSQDELRTTVENYETHALSLETGKPTDEPGGYQYFINTIGYGLGIGTTGPRAVGRVVAEVYSSMGAKFMVGHGKTFAFGQKALGGLYYRPEDYDLKLYESVQQTQDGGTVIEHILPSLDASSSRKFIGIKYHENNFYSTGGTPWWPVYWTAQNKEIILYPPYDVSNGTSGGLIQPQAQQNLNWTLYESTVQYIAEHPDTFYAVGLRDLANELGI
ncbi:MAG: hypothetical protein AAB448_04350 [Patescibacteria group bacterium]|mgnify:FL=1